MVNANLNNDHVDKLKEEKLPDVVSVWTGLPHDWLVCGGGGWGGVYELGYRTTGVWVGGGGGKSSELWFYLI